VLFDLLGLFSCEWNFVELESFIFWDITSYSPLKINRRFGEHIASIFNVKEYVEQAGCACDVLSRWFLRRYIVRR
jgi:hypothetical protein